MKNFLLLAALLFSVTACGTVRETLGLETQKGPDEFDVATAPPLAIPPDFTLRPPQPGAPRPQAINPQQAARDILTGGDSGSTAIAPSPDAGLSNTNNANGNVSASEAGLLGTLERTANVGEAPTSTNPENTRLQNVLTAPVTRDSKTRPQIELEEKGSFWDSWF